MKLKITLCALALFSTFFVTATNAWQADDIEKRLAKLDELIESERVKNHIPGLAIAIVKDDKVIFAKGYGYSNVEDKTPATADTIFAIGSSTKAFTGALCGMMVDEEKFDWDDPVNKFIPEYDMKVDTGDEEITIRDLLCHRVGYSRFGMIWAGGGLTREEVIKQGYKAEPINKFREAFGYNNVTYMTAGVCAAKSAGTTWEEQVRARLLDPLGMKVTTLSINDSQKDPNMSLGYVWDDDKEEYELLPMRNLDSIGPSGSINSSVNEMAQWVRLQLGKGKFENKQLISEKSLAETWTKQIEIDKGVDYGFGWMLQEWNGKKVVEHGGNIDGFAAQVTLLPEENIGYVLLTNVSYTTLAGSSIGLVFDTLLGEEKDEEAYAVGKDLNEFTGNFIANFGPFDEATMEVKIIDGKLAINVPGQTDYVLKSPDEEGKWYFELTNTIAVSFNRDESDKVCSVVMYQSGTAPEFLREDYLPKPDVPLSELQKMTGTFEAENGDNVEYMIRQNRLVAVVDGKGCFTLGPPNEDGNWPMRALPDAFQIRFNWAEDGTLESATRLQDDKEVQMTKVVGDVDADSLPPATELLAKTKKAYGDFAGADFEAIQATGSIMLINQGCDGTETMTISRDGFFLANQDFGRMAQIVQGYDGERGFSDVSLYKFEAIENDELNQFAFQHPLCLMMNYEETYKDIAVVGMSEIDGEKVFKLVFSGDEVGDRKVTISADTGLMLEDSYSTPQPMIGSLQVTVKYSDFREVNGLQFPFKAVYANPFTGKTVVEVKEVEPVAKAPKTMFYQAPPEDE